MMENRQGVARRLSMPIIMIQQKYKTMLEKSRKRRNNGKYPIH
jgi:hypothetical protein